MNNKSKVELIFDVVLVLSFMLYCAVTLPGISDGLIDQQYNSIKDDEYINGRVISFGKYNVNFTKYRKSEYNENWVIHEIHTNEYNTYLRLS